MNEKLWSAYDQMADLYLQHAADSAYNAHYDRPAVLATLGPVAGLDVLDAACGPGLYTRELLARGARVTGFDASSAMVELARAAADGRAQIDRALRFAEEFERLRSDIAGGNLRREFLHRRRALRQLVGAERARL